MAIDADPGLIDVMVRAFALDTERREGAPGAAPETDEIEAVLRELHAALAYAGLTEALPAGGAALLDVRTSEALRGAKSYPVDSAQHEALWGVTMLAQVRRKPREASRYLGLAQRCARLALAAPVAVAVGRGVKSVQEADRAGVIGLQLEGYASRYGETDLEGETMAPGAFDQIREEWASAPQPPILFDHGQDPDLRRRPIGYATGVTVDDVGLHVKAFIPRDPDPARFRGETTIPAFLGHLPPRLFL